jgi:hypothetical protein
VFVNVCVELPGFCDSMTSGCGPVASLRSGKRLGSPPREHQPRTSHRRADAGPCITEC